MYRTTYTEVNTHVAKRLRRHTLTVVEAIPTAIT